MAAGRGQVAGTPSRHPSPHAPSLTTAQVTPKNFGLVCNRFGLVCKEEQANEIFEKHNLPKEGCNMYKLTTNFLDSTNAVTYQHLVRKTVGSTLINRKEPDEPRRPHDPFKLARMPDTAWKQHHKTVAAGSSAVLPPIAR